MNFIYHTTHRILPTLLWQVTGYRSKIHFSLEKVKTFYKPFAQISLAAKKEIRENMYKSLQQCLKEVKLNTYWSIMSVSFRCFKKLKLKRGVRSNNYLEIKLQ